MIAIFYRRNGKLVVSQSEKELSKLSREDVLWIDLLSPSGEEKHTVDDFLGEEIQSRAQAEEIESSSRYSETENAIFANTNFLMPGPEDYTMEAVSFTFVDDCLTTLRDVPIRSFTELQRRIVAKPQMYPSGYTVFVSIMDQRVDLDADMIELMSKEIAQYSKRINQQEDINEDFLLDINQLQENTMIVRENIIDKQRLVQNMIKSDKYPPELQARFAVILQDITSLINHANFSFERLEYLQETVLGLINLDQNNIMKIFTLVSVLLMPPTLVASFYGMNVPLPFMDKGWAWLSLLLFMGLLVALVLYIFRKKKMF
ncbi:MAG: magnesium and cobalt transport protein CorA [Bacteroidales bacterium]|nr:magnesium and cobalt transport protein CorA [Bacteroidales bacterium]MBQ5979557.1 magnesium and cobalt transport protein CorA [Bacteroidales bacterium]MBQ6184880.1 magnesium and cobalt transport protein CorA [Bacteroidales bacterium]